MPPAPPPPDADTSGVSDGPGSSVGVQVVVVPSALMVSTPAVKVSLPLFRGVNARQVADSDGGVGRYRFLVGRAGHVQGAAAGAADPEVALGVIAPLPSSTGPDETPFCQTAYQIAGRHGARRSRGDGEGIGGGGAPQRNGHGKTDSSRGRTDQDGAPSSAHTVFPACPGVRTTPQSRHRRCTMNMP